MWRRVRATVTAAAETGRPFDALPEHTPETRKNASAPLFATESAEKMGRHALIPNLEAG
jgi:hypothetical protein